MSMHRKLNIWTGVSFLVGITSLAAAAALAHVGKEPGKDFPESVLKFKPGTKHDRKEVHWKSDWAVEDLGLLELHSTSADLKFEESPDDRIHAEFTGTSSSGKDPVTVTRAGKHLILSVREGNHDQTDVEVESTHSWRDHFHIQLNFDGAESGSVKILLPKAARLPVNFETVSGDVKGTLYAKAFGMKSVSGDVHLSGEIENFKMNTVSGDANLEMAADPSGLEFKSVSGDLSLKAPKFVSATATYTTVSGSVSAPEGLNPGDLGIGSSRTMTVGEGKVHLDFNTTSGDVSIE